MKTAHTTRASGQNRLMGTPTTSFTYDRNGNMLTKTTTAGTASYAWDYENRLLSAAVPNGGQASTVSFQYDPFGRRIQKSSSSGTTIYVYDGANIVGEYSATGGEVAGYAQGMGIDEPLAMQRSGYIGYYNADGLGSITLLTGSDAKPIASYVYDSFGNTTPTEGLFNPFRYTGREQDPETGLYYYRARYYDPAIGRFISEDPAGFQGSGTNFYAYVRNDPINLADPLGLCPKNDCISALKTAGQDAGAVARAFDDWSMFASSAAKYGIPADLLAAIAIRETGVQNIAQIGGGDGAGVFQIDLGKNSNVTSSQAYNTQWAANYAANMLATNLAYLGKKFPNFTPQQLLQATAASYNFGTGNIRGNPGRIDIGSTGNNYGRNVLNLMKCFMEASH